MSAKNKYGITKQHGESLSQIIAWLSRQENVNPLELGVLAEIQERISAHAHSSAILRVRIKNLGDRQKKPLRQASHRAPKHIYTRYWSEDDCDTLHKLYCVENRSVVMIAEMMDRSESAIHSRIFLLGLRRRRAVVRGKTRDLSYRQNGVLAVVQRIRARREAETMIDRDAAD